MGRASAYSERNATKNTSVSFPEMKIKDEDGSEDEQGLPGSTRKEPPIHFGPPVKMSPPRDRWTSCCHESFGQEGASVDGLDAGEEAGMPSCLGIEGSTDTRSFQAQGVFNFVVRQVDASMLSAMVRPRV